MVGGEADNAISKLCAGRVAKYLQVKRSAEPGVAQWDGKMAND